MTFADLLTNFSNYISYSLYEEVFIVFDKLLAMTNDVLSEQILKKCIIALVDKYTLKNKAHKGSLTSFMKALFDLKVKKKPSDTQVDEPMDPEGMLQQKTCYFELMCDFCFFDNVEQMFSRSKAAGGLS